MCVGWRRGFTLIELLIVVAIIAILAAIAVPNFLEAQTRSKVSRAKADQRTFATANEAYAVDWNRCALANNEYGKVGPPNCVADPTDPRWDNAYAQSRLTTPIAYITSLVKDPFKASSGVWNSNTGLPGHGVYMTYHAFVCSALNNNHKQAYSQGYTWWLSSDGPARNTAGNPTQILLGIANPGQTECAYDPTNGTMSWGWVIRTNKGIFSVPGS